MQEGRPFALGTETLIVFRGRVQWSKYDTYSVVKTKSAVLRVWWAGGALPPDIFVGQMVSAIGKIVTYDNGRDWRVSDALPITSKWAEVMPPVFDHFAGHVANPYDWAPSETLELYREGSAGYKRRYLP